MRRTCIGLAILLHIASMANAAPSIIEKVTEGVYVVRDDGGSWSGHMSLAVTHQNHPKYQAKKVLDLSEFPKSLWGQVKQMRVSAFFCVRDYSWHDLPKRNGLDEQFQVVVNGNANTYRTDCGAPVYQEHKSANLGWYDVVVPAEQFVRGVNEIIIRKAASDKKRYDDYLYLGIDNATKRGNSSVDLGNGRWTQEKLTVPGGNGEYMVRLYLLLRNLGFEAVWQPGQTPERVDPAGVILYAGSRSAKPGADGLTLRAGQSARVEWSAQALDHLAALKVTVEGKGDLDFSWLNDKGEAIPPARRQAPYTCVLPVGRALKPSGLVIAAGKESFKLTRIRLRAALAPRLEEKRWNIRPNIAPPAGKPVQRAAQCKSAKESIVLANASLRCRFSAAAGRLAMLSLYNEWAATEMARHPERIDLFLVEVDGKRYSGSRDFRLTGIHPNREGFEATLAMTSPPLHATLRAKVDDEGLRLGMTLANAGDADVDFKLAFPHLAGLAASEEPAADYYFFPWGGGIFSGRPAIVRRGYGPHEALYQLMDVFSPSRGAGLYVRADDAQGWHKGLAMRKHVPGQSECDGQKTRLRTREEYVWTNPLDAVPGIGLAYEYLRRTRGPGQSFAPADVMIAAHVGDWRVAMKAYADWAHRVWKWRPYPSRLKSVHNMIAAGWGQGFLFRDGRYRTDIITPMTDCIELMSWWEWSPLGPWGVSFDKLEEAMGPAKFKRWKPYFVKDPVTGKMMWNNQPGDYKGYNARFGGLPAFRKAVQTYKDMGSLVTLYTDPFRLDGHSCDTGRKHGKEWAVIGPKGDYARAYEVWNPCHYLPEVRAWVADTMGRVMQETGTDGIRLDEYGHGGWSCFNPDHQHTYAEPGVSQWNKVVAEATRMVHDAMDRVKPGLVLTIEHPGYDYLMQYIDGCITYDLTVQAAPMRPLEVNLQRFYFPECKAYELDHRRADPADKKKFWNGVASFGRRLPKPMYVIYHENQDVYSSRDCEPLVATLQEGVYANRFASGGKTFYHLYNATGHTFRGPAIAIGLAPDQHAFDMLECKPAGVVGPGRQRSLEVYLPRADVACIAVLPKLLRARQEGGMLIVESSVTAKGAALAVCGKDGMSLMTQELHAGVTRVDMTSLPREAKPACMKLLQHGALRDVVSVDPHAARR